MPGKAGEDWLISEPEYPAWQQSTVYRACVRSLLLYGAETWAMKKQLKVLLIQCDVRMLTYLMGMRWKKKVWVSRHNICGQMLERQEGKDL